LLNESLEIRIKKANLYKVHEKKYRTFELEVKKMAVHDLRPCKYCPLSCAVSKSFSWFPYSIDCVAQFETQMQILVKTKLPKLKLYNPF